LCVYPVNIGRAIKLDLGTDISFGIQLNGFQFEVVACV